MEINKSNKYFAFISYKREDEEWAVWFQHELENYHLPNSLNGRTDLPTEFRPVFRDIDELKAGNLPEQIYNALASSAYLVVICSPNSAKSEWVNKEIKDFIEIGKAKGIDNVRNIFPFIVDGRPYAYNEEEECFPQALRDLSEEHEQVGGNVNESGLTKAFVKVLAGMLPNVAFDELWNRYEHDNVEEERLKRGVWERFLHDQSHFVAEKVKRIFISYKRVDKEKVFKIKDEIEQIVREQCWIDVDGIESDAQFMNVIMNAIKKAVFSCSCIQKPTQKYKILKQIGQYAKSVLPRKRKSESFLLILIVHRYPTHLSSCLELSNKLMLLLKKQ